MPLEKALRQGEYLIYLTVIFITAVLLGFSMYLVFYRLYNLFTTSLYNFNELSKAIYDALSDVFLVVVFVELIDTFITYVEQRKIVVYKILDVALVALARELFIYVAPVNADFKIEKAIALVLGTLVVGYIDYLQRRVIARERRQR
ncbi:phosphate-starvation-inducible PsiE family protein [Pyrobaculum sp.]|uniref:phosphate-starvation-inducible PsiE family protein n=1 Tax=Pyrobaculum sp. TaxID=2004705 RepID=UPI00315FB9AC